MKSRILRAQDLFEALGYLADDQVVGMPTETVYGLAGDATSDLACQRIFEIKGRAYDNPLISHFAHPHQLAEYHIKLSSLAKDLLSAFTPGPLTLVLPAEVRGISTYARASLPTIAVRFPSHPLARSLLQRFGKPLVAPSANLSGRYSSTTAQMVYEQLGTKIPAIIDGGPCQLGLESSVLLVEPHQATILRYGSLTYQEIANVIGRSRLAIAEHLKEQLDPSKSVLSPGIKYQHYQPQKPLKLFGQASDLDQITDPRGYAILSLDELLLPFGADQWGMLATFGHAEIYARDLYCTLAKADKEEQITTILAYYHESLGDALSDRLKRSAGGTFLGQ